ncbi:hypothetical protein [Streptomyces sp. NPDC048669]|uniref:hypothetical protein n=1 Tax=Streptomyces sp. NPDC048669 TaxID=3155267 RepID=UPI003437A02A
MQQSEAWRIAKLTAWGTVGSAVIAAIIAGVFALITADSGSEDSPEANNSQPSISTPLTPTDSPTSNKPSAPPSEGSSSSPALPVSSEEPTTEEPPPPPEPDSAYLSVLTPKVNHYGAEGGPAVINGHSYSNSVSVDLVGCDKTNRHEVGYEFEPGWKNFSAWVGFSTESKDYTYKILMQVYRNDEPYGEGLIVKSGNARRIDIPQSAQIGSDTSCLKLRRASDESGSVDAQ